MTLKSRFKGLVVYFVSSSHFFFLIHFFIPLDPLLLHRNFCRAHLPLFLRFALLPVHLPRHSGVVHVVVILVQCHRHSLHAAPASYRPASRLATVPFRPALLKSSSPLMASLSDYVCTIFFLKKTIIKLYIEIKSNDLQFEMR